MIAMLLSAGFGRRMMPLTLELPKPAVPVLGRPMAVGIVTRMARHGVEKVVLNLHHLPQVTRGLFETENAAAVPEIEYSMEPKILGTAGGIGKAEPMLRGSGPVLIHNCDFLSDIDFNAVLEVHRSSGMAATLVLVPADPDHTTIETDAEGRVLSLGGQPQADPGRVAGRHTFTGCHVIGEELLGTIPRDRPCGIVESIYRPLAAEGRLGAYLHPGFWAEMGTPEGYLAGAMRLLELPFAERLEITPHDPVHSIGGCQVAHGPGATLDADLQLEGGVAVELASRLGRQSRIRNSVVMAGSWIGPGSHLDRVIVGPGVEIPAGFEGRRCLVCRARGRGPVADRPDLRVDGELLIYDFSADRLVGS